MQILMLHNYQCSWHLPAMCVPNPHQGREKLNLLTDLCEAPAPLSSLQKGQGDWMDDLAGFSPQQH